jgi:hypothetical protein
MRVVYRFNEKGLPNWQPFPEIIQVYFLKTLSFFWKRQWELQLLQLLLQ